MRCPQCGADFYPINTVDRPCMCAPIEIRNILAKQVELLEEKLQDLEDELSGERIKACL